MPHLSYIGDATIGAGCNIGAGVITANYDGVRKHRDADRRSRVRGHGLGADRPGQGGRRDLHRRRFGHHQAVGPGALAVARGRQRNIAGWVERKRPGSAADAAPRRGLGGAGGFPG